jgi:hypothetical protein
MTVTRYEGPALGKPPTRTTEINARFNTKCQNCHITAELRIKHFMGFSLLPFLHFVTKG